MLPSSQAVLRSDNERRRIQCSSPVGLPGNGGVGRNFPGVIMVRLGSVQNASAEAGGMIPLITSCSHNQVKRKFLPEMPNLF